MNLSDLTARLDELAVEAKRDFAFAVRKDDLVQAKNKFLGRKGLVKSMGAMVAKVPPEERPAVGREINRVKGLVESAFNDRLAEIEREAVRRQLEDTSADLTQPARGVRLSAGHPLIQIENELIRIFRAMGFDVASGPEIETDLHNFESLNFPPDHPARDMQDTMQVETVGGCDDLLLRTHTSPVQVRTMLKYKPPVRIIAPGVVYRHDHDQTHSPVFRQIECLHVDEGITLSHLKGTLTHFVRELFGAKTSIRLRPSFFPFTEPSAEVDVSCVFCSGKGCRVCKQTGWLEILGSGMVDPNVYRSCGYDPGTVTGYAFGLGVERVAMLVLGVPDIRTFYENDIRFLEQY
jgi:phenylalanyl-tRNA synthetase alpha chain